jgi:hypothetical protein
VACAPLDAPQPELAAAARVEPQADDHFGLAAESHESAPDDFPVQPALVYSVVPSADDSVLAELELSPSDWQAESGLDDCWAAMQTDDSPAEPSPDD